MSGITQTIPTYWGGISEQPDELKKPGQVTEAINVLPDITNGLLKRPGSKLIGSTLTSQEQGKWFSYYRDETEQYIGQVDRDGSIKMWECSNGTPITVNYDSGTTTALKSYLKHTAEQDIQTLTLNDYTYIANRTKTVAMSSTVEPAQPPQAFIELKKVAYANQYSVNLFDDTTTQDVTTATRVKIEKTDSDDNDECPHVDTQIFSINGFKLADGTVVAFNNKFTDSTWSTSDGVYSNTTHTIDNTGTDPVLKSIARKKLTLNRLAAHNNDHSEDVQETTNTFNPGGGSANHNEDYFLRDSQNNSAIQQYTNHYKLKNLTTGQQLISAAVTGTATTQVGIYADVVTALKAGTAITDGSLYKVTASWAANTSYTSGTQVIQGDFIYTALIANGGTQNSNTTAPSGTAIGTAVSDGGSISWKCEGPKPASYFDGGTLLSIAQDADGLTSSSGKMRFKFTSKHGLSAGDPVKFIQNGHALENLTDGTTYYAIPVASDYNLELAPTKADAIAGTNKIVLGTGDSESIPCQFQKRIDTYSNQEHAGDSSSYADLPFTIEQAATDSPIINLIWKNYDVPVGEWVLLRCNRPSEVLGYDSTHQNSDSDPGGWGEKGRERPYQARVDDNADGTWNGIKTEIEIPGVTTGGDVTLHGTNPILRDLYFRLTTTGQSVATGAAGEIIYKCRYTTTYDLLHGGRNWGTDLNAFNIAMKSGSVYQVTIQESSTSKVQANLGLIRPTPTSFDTKTTVTAESILGDIRSDIVTTSNFTDNNVQQIGNGIYITRSSGTFNISTPSSELINVLTSEVKDVADLPKQCKHGYVVKVANSEADEDDYYVKFLGNNGRDGDGVWEECVKPGDNTTYDPATMPIQLIREANLTFTVKQVEYDPAQVGDTSVNGTNPRASFVGKTINNLLFFRNRLVMLSDENVIMSRPGDFFNFWAKSAISYTATDVIDLSASSEYPAIIYDGISVNAGILLFSPNKQFMLTTDSDVLSPLTAKINSISNYNYNYKTNPFSLGTTVGFLDNAGADSRFFEMTSVLREGEPIVVEQTRPVPQLLPKDLTLVADSRENNVILFGTKNQDTVYGYRYFNTTNQRVQSSWFKWKLSGTLQYHCMLDDAYYAVIRNGDKDVIQRFDIPLDDTTSFITADNIKYRIHFDNYSKLESGSLTYDEPTDLTTFTLPYGYNSSNQLAVYQQIDGNTLGSYSPATLVSGTTYSLPGDFSGGCYLGYLFDMEIKLPSVYYQTQVSDGNFRSDTHSSLIVHRLKLSLGHTGTYTTTLHRKGKSDYTQILEAINTDEYTSNTIGFKTNKFQTIPVYDRNSNVTVTIKSSNPSPATLNSLTWEGDYSPKFYKRV